jgi:hypothetical protein
MLELELVTKFVVKGGKEITTAIVTAHGKVLVMPRRPVMRKKSRLTEPRRVLEFPSRKASAKCLSVTNLKT